MSENAINSGAYSEAKEEVQKKGKFLFCMEYYQGFWIMGALELVALIIGFW